MYAKIYNYKFQGLSEAKVAATFCSEALGKKIIKFNIRSLNISIGQCGSVAIHLKFETSLDLKNFDCLLYTSPSPRDPKTSRMPSSA